MNRTIFGERLLLARSHAGLTQLEAARAAGMSQGTLGELEREGKGSSYTAQLAAVYGVNATWLATGFGEMLSKEAIKDLQLKETTAKYDPITQEVIKLLIGTDERGKRKLLDAAQDAYELYRAHQARVNVSGVTRAQQAILDEDWSTSEVVPPVDRSTFPHRRK